jgi:large subunit ribosomal protein L17
LCTSLFEHGRITTTVQKAKEVRPVAERLITLGKRDTLHARRRAAGFLLKAAVVQELFGTIAARYADRNGGYTRIVKLGSRSGDGADLAIIELLGSELAVKKAEAAAEKTRKEKKPEAEGAEGTTEAAGDESVARKISKKIKSALKRKPSPKPRKVKKTSKDKSKKKASDDSAS